MAIRMVSDVREAPPAPRQRRRGALVSTDRHGVAWALDAEAFHREFDELFTGLVDDRGLIRFRARAAEVWQSDDPGVADYLAGLRLHTPEEWSTGFEERHLAEWYRLLMVPYLRPIRGFRSPVALKDGLPRLGWTPSGARRLAWGREFATLVGAYACEEAAAALAIVLPVGNKGWLHVEDAAAMLERFRSLDRRSFRDAQHLVPVVEDAYEVLAAFVDGAEPVVVLPPLT
ncbi:MAG: hypothetical protein KDB33_10990 [Acidimicrobiales bacterium]|nr:hypothetical protein [Acidimicrobiales bacterium]